jgi:hypothetical protein
MNEFRYLCPRCGQAYQEGQSITECPQCKVPLLGAAPVLGAIDLRGLPVEIDVARLMDKTLAERLGDEDVNAALRRVVCREFPQNHDGLSTLLDQELGTLEQIRNCNRLQAAEEMARSVSKLTIDPATGRPQMNMVRMEGNLESLPPDQQDQIRAQIAQAMLSGRPLHRLEFTLQSYSSNKTTWLGALALLGLFALVALLVWFRRH